jgi:hypothetical protein
MLANQTAFVSQADFVANDVIAHARRLVGTPTCVTSGLEDPFHPYIESLIPALPRRAVVDISPGGHTSQFFAEKGPAALEFLARHLAA